MSQKYQKEDRLFRNPDKTYFCDKVSKYAKGKDVREKLIKYIDLRADENIRKTAVAKNDSKLLPIVSRDLVAA